MNEEIILVNSRDEEIGFGDKMDVHKRGLLHRAFSIFIFDWRTKKMLLQKRARGKYHSGGLWTNACCSHPRKNETMENCLNARLREELGIETNFHIVQPEAIGVLPDGGDVIYECGKFSYFASFGDICENEVDHVFLYSPIYDGAVSDIKYNCDEIEEIKWVSMNGLKKWMEEEPDMFTAWFPTAFDLAYEVLCLQAKDIISKAILLPVD